MTQERVRFFVVGTGLNMRGPVALLAAPHRGFWLLRQRLDLLPRWQPNKGLVWEMKTRSLKTNKVIGSSTRLSADDVRRETTTTCSPCCVGRIPRFRFQRESLSIFYYARIGANIGTGILTNKAKGSVLSTWWNSSEYLRLWRTNKQTCHGRWCAQINTDRFPIYTFFENPQMYKV